jgi:hypothetical protein
MRFSALFQVGMMFNVNLAMYFRSVGVLRVLLK